MCTCNECKGITIINGKDGRGIVSVTDNGDGTLTFLYTDGTTYVTPDFTGPQGPQGPAGTNGLNGVNGTNGTNGTDGVGIDTIAWTSNSGGQPQGTQGTTDTYTITLTDASTYNFLVTNGADGATGSSLLWETRTNANAQTYTLPYANIGIVNERDAAAYAEFTLPLIAVKGDRVVIVDNKGVPSETRILPNTGQTIVVSGIGFASAPTGRIECPNIFGAINGSIEFTYIAPNRWVMSNYTYFDNTFAVAPPNVIP